MQKSTDPIEKRVASIVLAFGAIFRVCVKEGERGGNRGGRRREILSVPYFLFSF